MCITLIFQQSTVDALKRCLYQLFFEMIAQSSDLDQQNYIRMIRL